MRLKQQKRKASEHGPSESQELQLSTNKNIHAKVKGGEKEVIQTDTTGRIDGWKLGNFSHHIPIRWNPDRLTYTEFVP